MGCSSTGSPQSDDGANTEDFTDVNHSDVKRQSIGNCWLYATASWSESLAKSASADDKAPNFSESYWSYWHWFEQIVNGNTASKNEVSTGGSFGTAAELISRYGVVTEADFIPEEADAEMSLRQSSALSAINDALKNGALKDPAVRRDRGLVRKELDKAWRLRPEMTAVLDKVFGDRVSRTLDKSPSANAGTFVKRAAEIPIVQADAKTHQPVRATLADAIGRKNGFFGRSGPLAWQEASYPSEPKARREFLKRVQRALHDNVPVIISWYVDFNSLDGQGRFFEPPTAPGHQGGHMTVMEDYEIDDVPGFGTLKAGVLNTDPNAREAALSDEAKILFFRVKNSWGSFRPDRQFALPGYHDLYMAYLNGPVKRCPELPSGQPDTSDNLGKCFDWVPFQTVVMPPGY
jgi:hypothetical protein